jgi:hypothetical protein
MDLNLYNLIHVFSSSIFIALIIGIFTFSKLSSDLRIIFYYTVISSIIGAIMVYFSYRNINNTIYYNTFAVLEYFLLSYAIWRNQKANINKWLLIIGTSILSIMFFISLIDDSIIYNNTLKFTEASLLIILSVTFFARVFGDSFLKVAKDPFRYIIIGIFIYFSSSILISTAGNQTQLFTRDQLFIFFTIHAAFYAIMVFLIIISFVKCYKK